MRYIKPPKQISAMWWEIGKPLPLSQLDYAHKVHVCETDIAEYIITEGETEHILDARIFSSTLIRTLLGLE